MVGAAVLAGGRGRITGIPSTTRAKTALIVLIVVAMDPFRRLLLAPEGGEPFGLLHAFSEHV
jgi:hypothetical protein